MSGENNRHRTSTVDQQPQRTGDGDAVPAPQAMAGYFPFAQKQNALHGIGLMMIGASFLIVASTASVIGWTYFDAVRQKPAPLLEPTALADIQALQQDAARLSESNRQFQAELEGLSGPDGVLSRVIEQLQIIRRNDAAQTETLQHLLQASLTPSAETDRTGGMAAGVHPQSGIPIQVTGGGRAGVSEPPQMVIVTPLARAEGQGQ